MHISMLASEYDRYRRPYLLFRNARSAFKAFLVALRLTPAEAVLLPAYIGWSAREGSGVFDPVAELGLSYRFYRMDDRLNINLEHLRQLFRTGTVRVLVIIHYFGHVDPCYPEAVAMAREFGACVLEDEAHAMFTDLVGGISGRMGDAAIFSLHKMLPVEKGGMLVINRDCHPGIDRISPVAEPITLPWEFDLFGIARKRIENAEYLVSLLEPYAEIVEPLWTTLDQGEVPQTLPVIIRKGSRDRLYQMMNDAGYGVVTLYHTMIDRISRDDYPESHLLSGRILNLPVHQDAERSDLAGMIEKLLENIRKLSSDREVSPMKVTEKS